MSNNELDQLKRDFVSQWSLTSEYQKIFFINELNKIRENSFKRNILLEKIDNHKNDLKIVRERYNKNSKNSVKWIFGFLIFLAVLEFFKFIQIENVYYFIILTLLSLIFYTTLIYDFIEIKSFEIKIITIENFLDELSHKNLFVSINKSLFEELGCDNFDFNNLNNNIDFQRFKIYLLSSIRTSSVFDSY